MKHVKVNDPNVFKPFIIGIQIESVEDAIKIYSLFNHTSITECFEIPEEVHTNIRDSVLSDCPAASYYKSFFEKADQAMIKMFKKHYEK